MHKRLLFSLLFLPCILFAQVDETKEDTEKTDVAAHLGNNAISLNVQNFLLFFALDMEYEYALTNKSAIGIEFFTKLEEDSADGELTLSEIYAKDISAIINYKYFLSENKPNAGAYFMAFAMYSDGRFNDSDDGIGNNEGSVDYTDFAIGIGGGYRLQLKNTLFFNFSGAIGRNLFNEDAPQIVLVPDVSIGFRF